VDSSFVIKKDGVEHEARGSHVINATGIISQPRLPDNFYLESCVAGDTVLTPALKISRPREQLLVVGGGASAAEVLREPGCESGRKAIAPGCHCVQNSARFRTGFLGIDVHYFAWLPEQISRGLFGWRAGRLTEPMTGRAVVKAIRKGLIKRMPEVRRYDGGIVEFVRWSTNRA
jgi:hypothetical protein